MPETIDTPDGPPENWFLLMDSDWRPRGDAPPPPEAVVGLWPITAGNIGPFQPNPAHVPLEGENGPTDPLDGALRSLIQDATAADTVRLLLRDTWCDVALGDAGPLVTAAPDGVPCVVVVTAGVHRTRVRTSNWRRVLLTELVALLPAGADALFNPGGPAAVRLTGDFLRATARMTDAEFTLPPDGRAVDDLRLLEWDARGPS